MRTMKLKYIFLSFFLLIIFVGISQNASAQIPQSDQDLIKSYMKNADSAEVEGDKNKQAFFINKIAFTYWENNQSGMAIEFFKRSISLNREIGNQNAIRAIYFNIGEIYLDEHNLQQSFLYHSKSLKLAKELGNKTDITRSLLQVGDVHLHQKKYSEAISKTEEALSMAKEIKNLPMIRTSYGLLSELYKNLGDAQKSLEYFNYYSTFEKELQRKKIEEQTAEANKKVQEITAEANKKVSEKEKELLAKSDSLRETKDSLLKVEQIKKEKELQIDLLNKNKALQDAQMKEQKIQIEKDALFMRATVIVLILILTLAIVMFRNYKVKQRIATRLAIKNVEVERRNLEIARQNKKIENQNKEISKALEQIQKQNLNITKSISYAQRIQIAMMPRQESLKNYVKESFIMLKPRDIVSGDFYWFTPTNSKTHNTIFEALDKRDEAKEEKYINKDFIISAIDCTGHGVPGAFMSMIGFNLLNEIVGKGICEADLILNALHKGIRAALRQETTDNRDGMDMSLCVVRPEKNIVEFSGAKNPLIYIKKNKIVQIKGDREPIGGIQREKERLFKKHIVEVDAPTTFYIFSDGFQDQFGGEKGRKFMKKRFRELLFKIHKEAMNKQKQILDQVLKEWIGDEHNRIDDILVIGFRLYPFTAKRGI